MSSEREDPPAPAAPAATSSEPAALARQPRERTIPTRLSPRERAFSRAYGHPASPTRYDPQSSALQAGYPSGAAGYRLLRRARIRASIDRYIRASLPSADRLKSELSEVALSQWGEHLHVVRNPRTGEIVSARIDLKDKVKAAELLLRAQGAFEDPVKRALGRMIMAQVKQVQALAKSQRGKLRSPAPAAQQDILEAEVLQAQEVGSRLPSSLELPEAAIVQNARPAESARPGHAAPSKEALQAPLPAASHASPILPPPMSDPRRRG